MEEEKKYIIGYADLVEAAYTATDADCYLTTVVERAGIAFEGDKIVFEDDLSGIAKSRFKIKLKSSQETLNHIWENGSVRFVVPLNSIDEYFVITGYDKAGNTFSYQSKFKFTLENKKALIMVPTRELAVQIAQRCKDFFIDFDIKIACLTGGVDTLREKNRIQTTPQILVGTPEKICEIAVNSGLVNLSTVTSLVIDEADMTLEFGFLEDIDAICSRMADRLQMMSFSATVPEGLKLFLRKLGISLATILIW